MSSELQRLATEIRGSIHSIESRSAAGDDALVMVHANRSLTPVLVPAELVEQEKITQECVIELTVVQPDAGTPLTATDARVRSHALPLPVDITTMEQ